ncbi:hypothetical protein RI129_005579 [Pyrocoelia pectoralis]|uniref:Uncharacterized protein n=1 Tax=Pyrocoelia pectoralis TaxID=417401 RepID=A0AAN7VF38_9COLE
MITCSWSSNLLQYSNYLNYFERTSFTALGKTLVIDRFMGKCPGYENMPVYLDDIHLYPTDGTYNVSAKMVVTRDLLPDLKLVLQLERCKAKEDLDSCEPYQNVNRNNLCDMAKAKKQAWTPFISNTKPEVACPALKGTYNCTHTVFDATPLMVLPISGWYWKVKSLIYEVKENKPVMCVYISGQLK